MTALTKEDSLHTEFFGLLPDPVGQEAAGCLVPYEETVVGDVVAVAGEGPTLAGGVEDLGGGDDGEGKELGLPRVDRVEGTGSPLFQEDSSLRILCLPLELLFEPFEGFHPIVLGNSHVVALLHCGRDG